MKTAKNVEKVLPEHIKPGIKKYGGEIDTHLASLIKFAGLNYTPYKFKDGRILLVLPNEIAAFLYKDKETLFEALSLES